MSHPSMISLYGPKIAYCCSTLPQSLKGFPFSAFLLLDRASQPFFEFGGYLCFIPPVGSRYIFLFSHPNHPFYLHVSWFLLFLIIPKMPGHSLSKALQVVNFGLSQSIFLDIFFRFFQFFDNLNIFFS